MVNTLEGNGGLFLSRSVFLFSYCPTCAKGYVIDHNVYVHVMCVYNLHTYRDDLIYLKSLFLVINNVVLGKDDYLDIK